MTTVRIVSCGIIIYISFIYIVISLFICQVNICKSYTHTNEIIMITNIFFPCFIA